jgi:ABC-type branched-subunit amino acid transport system substrate-binding protein
MENQSDHNQQSIDGGQGVQVNHPQAPVIQAIDSPITIHNHNYGTSQPEPTVRETPQNLKAASRDTLCPYRDLRSFQEEDECLFFGRETFTTELEQALQRQSLVTVIGPSGSGKSSVVFAGLVPRLRPQGTWLIQSFRPSDDLIGKNPFKALAAALVPLLTLEMSQTDQLEEIPKLADKLQQGTVALVDVIQKILQKHPHHSHLLLIGDQFEELYANHFTEPDQVTEQHQFIDILLEAVQTLPRQLKLIVTLRADFLSFALNYPPLGDALQHSPPLLLGAMTDEELRSTIEKPLQQRQVQIADGLTERILEDVRQAPGNLPLLEFALTQLWGKQTEGRLTHQAYDEIGGVRQALANYAEETYAQFDDREQLQIQRIFLQLVRPGAASDDTRRLATRDEMGSDKWALVTQLANQRLVVTSRDRISEVDTVELVHEALIREWERLQQWMQDNRLFRIWQHRLRSLMGQWEETDHNEGVLLRGAPLAEAQTWLAEREQEISDAEKAFIKASVKRRDHARTLLVWGLAGVAGVALVLVGVVANNLYLSREKERLYQQFAYCPTEKGRPGETVGDKGTCFRNLKTSGEVGVFLSSTNFQLDQGREAFKKKDYEKAKKLFEEATYGDRTDPVPQIFLNNTLARQHNESLGLKPLKLAVVTSVDYYESAAMSVLWGVADAQTEFNQKRKETQNPLMEIVIVNDENEPEAARKIAKDLVDDPNVLGVIGHHASESTFEAQKIYKAVNMPIISATSSSSRLEGKQFFRIIGSTRKAAERYANHIRKSLGLDKIVVLYKEDSKYSNALKDDFNEEFPKQKGKILENIEIGSDGFKIAEKLKEIVSKHETKAALIISSVKTNSMSIAINRYNAELPTDQKLQLLGTISLSERETLAKGAKAIEGMILVKPCLPSSSDYVNKAAERWGQTYPGDKGTPALDWRTVASYDATQAFAKAITLSKTVTRDEILQQLKSPSFSLKKEETSGFGLKWDLSGDRSNANQKYCVVQVKNGRFLELGSN